MWVCILYNNIGVCAVLLSVSRLLPSLSLLPSVKELAGGMVPFWGLTHVDHVSARQFWTPTCTHSWNWPTYRFWQVIHRMCRGTRTLASTKGQALLRHIVSHTLQSSLSLPLDLLTSCSVAGASKTRITVVKTKGVIKKLSERCWEFASHKKQQYNKYYVIKKS